MNQRSHIHRRTDTDTQTEMETQSETDKQRHGHLFNEELNVEQWAEGSMSSIVFTRWRQCAQLQSYSPGGANVPDDTLP